MVHTPDHIQQSPGKYAAWFSLAMGPIRFGRDQFSSLLGVLLLMAKMLHHVNFPTCWFYHSHKKEHNYGAVVPDFSINHKSPLSIIYNTTSSLMQELCEMMFWLHFQKFRNIFFGVTPFALLSKQLERPTRTNLCPVHHSFSILGHPGVIGAHGGWQCSCR